MKDKVILTADQIQDLYDFTHRHHVEYYDLQTELVDHLAVDIEMILESDIKLNYEEAKQKAFSKFGVLGFSKIVELRQKALGKKYRSILWSFMKAWYSLPKIILTGFLVYMMYYLMTLFNSFEVLFNMSVLLVVIFIGKGSFMYYNYLRRIQKTDKKWMLEEYIFKIGLNMVFLWPTNFLVLLRPDQMFYINYSLFSTRILISIGFVFFWSFGLCVDICNE